MTVYEKRRLAARDNMDKELYQLDQQREHLGDKKYWQEFAEISKKYQNIVKEIDEAESTAESIVNANNSVVKHDRPEQNYVDILGQLKAAKLNSLLRALAENASAATELETVDISDPFYLDKVNPIAAFERWWDKEISEYPSISDMKKFLDRVGINSKGYLVFNGEDTSESSESLESRKSVSEMNVAESQNLLRANVLKTSRQRAKERHKERGIALHKKMPLLALGDGSEYEKRLRKAQRRKDQESWESSLCDVVEAYDLPVELADLLKEHIRNVCVIRGLTKVDEYKPMLEQFLRYETDPQARIAIVKRAIEKNWRVLSNGTV